MLLQNKKNDTHDLIRLDSSSSDNVTADFDPLLTKSDSPHSLSSVDVPECSVGLTNPLYPYYTPPVQTPNNTSIKQPNNTNDFDLLKEYGLDFKSLTSQQNSPNITQNPAHGQASWTKFND